MLEDKTMKITVIRHSIRNRGGDKLVLDYCDYLVDKGHEVIYWTNEVNTYFSINPCIQIKQIPYPQIKGTIRFTLLTKFESDVVLVDLVVMSIFASILNGKKVVYLAQDDDRTYYSSGISRFIMQIIYWIAFLIFRVQTVAVSGQLTQKLEKLAKGKVKLVPNGIDHRRFYHEDNSPHATEKKALMTVVLYARSDFRKGLDIGIKAVEELARLRGIKDWELWTIGDDVAQINVDGLNVKRWGFLKGDDLRNVLSVADIYLSPSRHEGFGLMQLEAIACGNVMVTTKGFPLVSDGINGLVYPIGDWLGLGNGLNLVMNDKALFARLQQNGYSLAQNYSLEKSCIAFERLLGSFLGKK